MKKIKWIVALFIVVFLLFLAVGIYIWQDGGYQSVSVKGYTLLAPKSWEISREENAVIFSKGDVETGRFSLLYQEAEPADIPAMFGFSAEGLTARESDQYAVKVYELGFEENGHGVVQYVFGGLPAAPPYAAVLTLIDADSATKRRMIAGFSLPELGENPPPKPLPAPDAAFLEEAVYSVATDDGRRAYHVSKLTHLMNRGEKEKATDGVHLLSYKESEESILLETWYYLQTNGGVNRLYTYYPTADGSYIYDNDPQLVKRITKEVSAEEDYIRYFADGLLLLDTPYNPYTENKETLMEEKGAQIGDNTAVRKLIDSALPVGISVESITLETETEPFGLTATYTITDRNRHVAEGVLDEAPFYQHALVLFSLIDNVDTISLQLTSEGDLYKLFYERKQAEEQFDNRDLRSFSETEESFEGFVEEVPAITPPPMAEEEGSGKTNGVKKFFSYTFTVHSGMKVTHPNTGALVQVDPYAERYGVSRYLDKPITVEAYEQITDGETRVWGVAICEGVTIGTYPFASREEAESMIALLP